MTKDMYEFLEELAGLLIKHNVELEAVDDDADYYPSVAGIECSIKSKYESIERLGIYTDGDSIKKLLNEYISHVEGEPI